MDEGEESQAEGAFSPNLGILCHGFEPLGFWGKKVSSFRMSKVLEEQSGLGEAYGRGDISLEVIQMALEEAEMRCDRTLILKSNLNKYLTSGTQIAGDKTSFPQWDIFRYWVWN